MSTVPTLTVNVTNVTAALQDRSMSVSRNGADFTLIAPAYVPVLDDTVAITAPTWAGSIVSVESVGYRGNVAYLKCRATNEDELPDLGAAPWGLSDVPNEATTFGFSDLGVTRIVDSGGTAQTRAKLTIYKEGLSAGMEIAVTSVVEGLSAETFTIMDLTTDWPTDDAASYTLDLGLGDYTTATEAGLFPIHLDDTVTEVALGGAKVRLGDLLTGDNSEFTGTLGDWINSGGSLVRDTTAGFRYSNLAASLKFTTSAQGQYIECPVPGTFVAGREYQALLLIQQETAAGSGTSWKVDLGKIGTDSAATLSGDNQGSGVAGLFVGHYTPLLARWVPSANRTGVTLRFTRAGAETGTIVWHVGWARAVALVPDNSIGLSIFSPPDPSDNDTYAAGLFVGFRLESWNGGPVVGIGRADAYLSAGGSHPASVYLDAQTTGDLADAGISFTVGTDSEYMFISEKDATTLQLYQGTDDHTIELRDRGTSGWVAVDSAGTPTGLLSKSPYRSLAAAPGSPTEGDTYYDTVTHALYVYNGTSWVTPIITETPETAHTGQLLISDTPSTPLVFADLLQNEATTDLIYEDT